MSKKKDAIIKCPACGGTGARVVVNYNQCETVQCVLCSGRGSIEDPSTSEIHISNKINKDINNIYI
ncbi:MAG: hypothetical protein M1481_02105 [Candidatus Thermoplasmatota archaeon]|jgi:DnaJ-class molecular chaperone|nr:hypothetical protein [Candidatus Thermoplasmatota archaeon]MCL5963595.1 hypothetical protein [Candidatus Thermoplasmatota archaeon]